MRALGLAGTLLVLVSITAPGAAPGAQPTPGSQVLAGLMPGTLRRGSEDSLYARIEAARLAASRIRIDGSADDWKGIPIRTSEPVAGREPAWDIVRSAIAPLERELLVMVATAAPTKKEPWSYWFRIDCTGDERIDFAFQVSQPQQPPDSGIRNWLTWGPDLATRNEAFTGIEVASGDVMEVRVPYAELARYLPKELVETLTGPKARSWMRLECYRWRRNTDERLYGVAAASYRLLPTRYPLDPPLDAAEPPLYAVPLPLAGQWHVLQGGHSPGRSHEGLWAYDLDVRDATHSSGRLRRPERNEETYAWDQLVYAPQKAKVLLSRTDAPDRPPSNTHPEVSEMFPPNRVLLELPGELRLSMLHFRQNTVTVKAGTEVLSGALLGRVGNSGRSQRPHLHLALYHRSDTLKEQPLAFANVRVSLNLSPGDPWSRDFERWEPREGFFVESLQAPLATAP